MARLRRAARVSLALIWLALAGSFLSAGGRSADMPPYAASQLRLLFNPTPTSPTAQWATLNAIAKDAGKKGERLVYVYLWVADKEDLAEPQTWWVPRDELRWLSYAQANLEFKAQAVISVVTVYPLAPQDEREEVYKAIVRICAKEENDIRIPVYVDVANMASVTPGGLYDLIVAARPKGEMLRTPLLFCMDTQTDGIVAIRGNAPIRADSWVLLQRRGDGQREGVATRDPEDTQGSWVGNWFRRHMARAAHLLDLKADGHRPEDPISDVDFVNALRASGRAPQATPILPGCDPDRPEKAKRLTRQRAVAATVRFLYGSGTLLNCPPPNQGGGGEDGDWGRAFDAMPGSTQVSSGLRKASVFSTALAKGLLYDEPVFRPDVPIRRDEAAWLISHALAAHGTQDTTGLLIDAIDVPFLTDSPFARGDIYFDDGSGTDGKSALRRVYPTLPLIDTLPTPPMSYPSVLLLSAQQLDQRSRHWLEERIGKNHLVVPALDVAGPRQLPGGVIIPAASVLISKRDAETIDKLNRENGMLDDWRVAFMTGAGARIWPPLEAVIRRGAPITIQFTAQMDGRTIQSPKTVWIEAADDQAPTPIPVEIEPPQSGTKTIIVRVPKTLVPGGRYRLLLGTDMRTAQGSPMSLHPVPDPALPDRAARVWEFRVDPMVQVYLRPAGVPAGSKLEAKVGDEWLEVVPNQLVSVPAGQIELQLRTADGNVFPQQALHVDQDGSYAIKVALPKPARVAVSMPPYVTVGETTRVVLRGIDSEGRVMLRHAPVDVTLSVPSGGVVTPAWLLMTGEAAVDFRPNTPGRATLRISVMDKDVACDPELTVLCRSPLSSQLDWSDEERYHSLSPDQGKRDTRISPRLRRWFAQADEDATPKHRVKLSVTSDGDRRELSESATPPLRYEFKRDSEGFLYVNRNDGDDLLLAYEYRRGRCGLLITGNQGPAPPKELRSELERLLGRIGYECVTDAELVAALGTGYAPGEMPTDAQAAAAIAALSLDDVFAAHLARADRDVYDLSWTVWTRGQAASWSSQGQQVPSRRIRIGTEPGRGVNPKELRAATQALLDPWLKLVGLSFGTDMPRGAR